MHFYFKRNYGLYIMLSFVIKENNDEKWDICLPVFLKRNMCPQPTKLIYLMWYHMACDWCRQIFKFKTLF